MYNSSVFQLNYSFHDNTMTLHMQMLLPHVSTTSAPDCVGFLADHCPGVLKTKCFNEKKLPFYLEAKNTELGHLFEHVLLDQLCNKKISRGHENAEFSGITQWDWEQEPYGSFRITINLSREDLRFFATALKATIRIFEKFISTIPTPAQSSHPFSYRTAFMPAALAVPE